MKLDELLEEMDSFETIGVINVDGVCFLRVKFHCYSGGEFESIELIIDFLYPDTFHLPSFASGSFKLKALSPKVIEEFTNGREDLPSNIVGLYINNKDESFYVGFEEMFWKVDGLPSILVERINQFSNIYAS